MDPGTALLLALFLGVGATGYVAAAPDARTFRASRGALGAARAGWTSGRTTAGTAFSRPPARPQTGTSSFADDLGWALRQLWAAVRVGGAAVRGARRGYAPAVDVATARRDARRTRRSAAAATPGRGSLPPWLRALLERVGARTAAVGGAAAVTDRIAERVGRPTSSGQALPTPATAPVAAQNGAPMTATSFDIPTLAVVTEFTSPGQMEEPLEDLGQLAAYIAAAQAALVEGLQDFVNGYAEAKFTTAGLTDSIAAMVEAIDDEGHVNVTVFAEKLAPVAEAINEAKTLGEGAAVLEAEGDVEAFREG